MDILYAIIPYYNFFGNQKRIEGLNILINKYKNIKNLKIILSEGIVDSEYELPDFSNEIFKHKKYYYNQKIWIKENLINLIIQKELPSEWNYVCWIDADVLFRQKNWVDKTLDGLKNSDLIQMFDFALMAKPNSTKIESFYTGYVNSIINKDLPFKDLNFESSDPKIGMKGHCGFSWAITKNFYNQIGKIWDLNLIGGGDKIIAHCSSQFFNEKDIEEDKINIVYSKEYTQNLIEYYNRFKNCKSSFIDQQIFVYWHGDIELRRYAERHNILKKYNFNKSFINYDNGKIYIKDKNIVEDIENYMKSREILN